MAFLFVREAIDFQDWDLLNVRSVFVLSWWPNKKKGPCFRSVTEFLEAQIKGSCCLSVFVALEMLLKSCKSASACWGNQCYGTASAADLENDSELQPGVPVSLQQALLCWWILLGIMWHMWKWSFSLYSSRQKHFLIQVIQVMVGNTTWSYSLDIHLYIKSKEKKGYLPVAALFCIVLFICVYTALLSLCLHDFFFIYNHRRNCFI